MVAGGLDAPATLASGGREGQAGRREAQAGDDVDADVATGLGQGLRPLDARVGSTDGPRGVLRRRHARHARAQPEEQNTCRHDLSNHHEPSARLVRSTVLRAPRSLVQRFATERGRNLGRSGTLGAVGGGSGSAPLGLDVDAEGLGAVPGADQLACCPSASSQPSASRIRTV